MRGKLSVWNPATWRRHVRMIWHQITPEQWKGFSSRETDGSQHGRTARSQGTSPNIAETVSHIENKRWAEWIWSQAESDHLKLRKAHHCLFGPCQAERLHFLCMWRANLELAECFARSVELTLRILSAARKATYIYPALSRFIFDHQNNINKFAKHCPFHDNSSCHWTIGQMGFAHLINAALFLLCACATSVPYMTINLLFACSALCVIHPSIKCSKFCTLSLWMGWSTIVRHTNPWRGISKGHLEFLAFCWKFRKHKSRLCRSLKVWELHFHFEALAQIISVFCWAISRWFVVSNEQNGKLFNSLVFIERLPRQNVETSHFIAFALSSSLLLPG